MSGRKDYDPREKTLINCKSCRKDLEACRFRIYYYTLKPREGYVFFQQKKRCKICKDCSKSAREIKDKIMEDSSNDGSVVSGWLSDIDTNVKLDEIEST